MEDRAMSESPSDRLGSVLNRLTNGPGHGLADVIGLPDPQGWKRGAGAVAKPARAAGGLIR